MRSFRLLTLAALLGACQALPRDAEGTLDRIGSDHRLRVGVTHSAVAVPEADRLVGRLATATGAHAAPQAGELEPMLTALEHGDLDLAVAWFDSETPWVDRVALGPPLRTAASGGRTLELRAAARNGENRWIMLIETSSRAVAPDAAE